VRNNSVLSALLLLPLVTVSAQQKPSAPAQAAAPPLLLEKNEGETRLWRPEPGEVDPGGFILKVTPKTNGSHHLVLSTGEMAPRRSHTDP
jgi:hypothetical protein